jgi:hypothetical protein
MSRRARILLVLTPLLVAIVYVALNWWQLEDHPVWVRAGPEARANRFLAFERFLGAMGARKEIVESPAQLTHLPPGTTLFLAAHRLAYMNPRAVASLVEWVNAGGHLVVQSEFHETRDPLLDAFSIERKGPDPAKATTGQQRKLDEQQRQQIPPEFEQAIMGATPVAFEWPGAQGTLRVNMPASTQLKDRRGREPLATITANKRTVAISLASGNGTITVVPSFAFLLNSSIGKNDHAEFGWLLASHGVAAPRVLLFLRFESLPLTEWIWREAWTVVIAAALFLLAWLSRVIPRFGPLVPDAPPERRSLAEHIIASGRFLWSRGQRRYLVAAVRERALRFARARGLAEREVPAVGGTVETAPAFVSAITKLAAIETRLARRGAMTRTAEDKKP